MGSKWQYLGFWDSLGSLEMVYSNLITPTYPTYMEVSFFAGIAGKKKEAVEVGTLGRESQAQLLSKGKKSSLLLCPMVPNDGWEEDGSSMLHI